MKVQESGFVSYFALSWCVHAKLAYLFTSVRIFECSAYLRVARPVLRVQHSRHLRRTNLRVHANCDDWSRNDGARDMASERYL